MSQLRCGCHCHLVGRGQGCCEAQRSPPIRQDHLPKRSLVLRQRNPALVISVQQQLGVSFLWLVHLRLMCRGCWMDE